MCRVKSLLLCVSLPSYIGTKTQGATISTQSNSIATGNTYFSSATDDPKPQFLEY